MKAYDPTESVADGPNHPPAADVLLARRSDALAEKTLARGSGWSRMNRCPQGRAIQGPSRVGKLTQG